MRSEKTESRSRTKGRPKAVKSGDGLWSARKHRTASADERADGADRSSPLIDGGGFYELTFWKSHLSLRGHRRQRHALGPLSGGDERGCRPLRFDRRRDPPAAWRLPGDK